jgi:MFS family permease
VQLVLLGVPFLDELGTGLPVAGAPALQDELFGSLAALGFVVFTLPQLLAFVLEPPLLVFLSRYSRAANLRFGLAGYGIALVLAALASAAWLFALAWTLVWMLSGVSCANAQAELIDRAPEQSERRLAEWTLGGALGDLAAPLLLAAVVWLGCSFRVAWVLAGLAFITWGVLAGRSADSRDGSVRSLSADPESPEAERLSFRALWQKARENPQLVAWLFGATLCSLMDETLVAFCALWMRARFGSDSAVTVGVFALMLGGFTGLLALHRLLPRVEPRRLLLALCLGAMLALAAWLSVDSLTLSVLALGALGACAATHYPLAQAAAYRALPGAPGSVAALGQLFGPLDLAIPVVLGLLADRCGLMAALVGLLLQPLGLIAALSWRARPRQASKLR